MQIITKFKLLIFKIYSSRTKIFLFFILILLQKIETSLIHIGINSDQVPLLIDEQSNPLLLFQNKDVIIQHRGVNQFLR